MKYQVAGSVKYPGADQGHILGSDENGPHFSHFETLPARRFGRDDRAQSWRPLI